MEELDRLPDTSFERDVVCEDQEAFCLSKENLEALHELLFQVRYSIVFKAFTNASAGSKCHVK